MRNWSFFPRENRLESGDEVAHLTGKAAAVLDLLARRPGQVVTREEILAQVWKGVHVTPDLVREYIFDLRRALGDDAAAPVHIETIRGKGFRLIGGVDLVRSRLGETVHDQRARVAVLRPVCFEGGPRWQRFADGMAEELMIDLARFSDIAVIARTASFGVHGEEIAEIGDRLGCDYLVESALSAWPDRLRVQCRLVEVRSGTHLWAERYERPVADLPELSSEIALLVANELGGLAGEILRAERRYAKRRPARELTAYENYVIACELELEFDAESSIRGLEHIDRAIELDPDFARSHLIRNFFCDHGMSFAPERGQDHWFDEQRRSADAGYRLDPRDPMIIASQAKMLAASGDLREACDLTMRSADFAANQADPAAIAASGATLIAGEFETADRLLRTAFELNPVPPAFYHYMHARNLLFWGRYEEAEAATLKGPDYISTHVARCLAQSLQGKVAAARATLARIRAAQPGFEFAAYPRSLGMANERVLAVFREGVARLGEVAPAP